jgi:hypothetical protein
MGIIMGIDTNDRPTIIIPPPLIFTCLSGCRFSAGFSSSITDFSDVLVAPVYL